MLRITIPKAIVDGMFVECSKYPNVETGGRLIGFYTSFTKDFTISVRAVLSAGPKAQRTRTSFFNDGEYQEKLFRAVEGHRPDIHHLGNWHGHHCNGLTTLSHGDVETYLRMVNSPNHATNFFLSLLVIKNSRYSLKGFLAIRHTSSVKEVTKFLEISSQFPVLDLK